ncbi:hypothetical protein MRS44_005522 [Fusarium solani]|uniref:uncharacterized protein n=1 Tax=Fusarium solani TaxID=169388 RepID=UPI0032C448D8|nr:hypothetical protein MRS44_005522 [Fusarium solani]
MIGTNAASLTCTLAQPHLMPPSPLCPFLPETHSSPKTFIPGMAFKSAIGKAAEMEDDSVSAHNQVVSNTLGEPLSDTEPKGEMKAPPSSNSSFSHVLEEFPASDEIQDPAERRHECEPDTPDANGSDSDWESIDEDTSEELVDDESTSNRTTEDHEISDEATEGENASELSHFGLLWGDGDALVELISSHADPNNAFAVQFIRAMGKMYQKHGKFELAEPLLRVSVHELGRIAGRLHEHTLSTVFSLAAVLSHQGKLDEAGKLGRRAIRGYLKVKGPGNDATMRVLREISCAYSDICRQLLQHDPPAGSQERYQVSRHTDMYISICQELPLSAASAMLGSLGSVLALAGHTTNANLAFQWKYASPLSRPHYWHECNMCGQEILSLPVHVCLTCMGIELCSPCYRSLTSSNVQGGSEDSSVLGSLSCCMAHEFFKIEKNGAQQISPGDDSETTDAFNAWLRDTAEEVQGANTVLRPEPFVTGAEETPTDALSTYIMRRVTTDTFRVFMGLQVAAGDAPSRLDNSNTTNSLKAWLQDSVNNAASPEAFFGANLDTVAHSLIRQIIAKAFQDEDLWNPLDNLWKYSQSAMKSHHAMKFKCVNTRIDPNYPPNQQEAGPFAELAAHLMAEVRRSKETIPKELSSPVTSRVIPSDFFYDTLPLNEGGTLIRLLELLPGETAEPLVCNLVVEDMLDSPVYEAVSYTWGNDTSPTHEAEVEVNSVRLQVTPNLHACLLALRHRDASRMLWVDAICINQKNNQEKSEQVARMTSIYNSASNVLVYLGDGGEAEEALFKYFNREGKEEESFQDSIDRLGLVKLDILKTFVALCSREWWARIWIQQEFALPPTEPIFCLGHLRTQALHLHHGIRKMLSAEDLRMIFSHDDARWSLAAKAAQHIDRALATLSMRYSFRVGPKNLSTLLSTTPQSKCSDPRDVIFGRYIFMKPILRAVFKPDYSLTTESLFGMAAIWLLKIEVGMELFWFYPSRLSSKSPSWVPDFTKRASEIERPFPTVKGQAKWRAEDQADDPLDIDRGILKIYGRPLDIITDIFRVGDAPLPELVGQILFLEHSLLVIAEQDIPERRHPLSEVLPGLKAKVRPQEWSLGIHKSIYGWVPEEVYSALFEAVTFVQSQVLDSHSRFFAFPDACLQLNRRFVDFYALLGDQHLAELFWASLCDFRNLIARIKDLRIPRPPSSPLSEGRQGVMFSTNQMIKEIQVPDVPSSLAAENEDTMGISSSSNHSYEELQAIIADCELEEEVQLRARFIVQLAKLIKSSVDADGRWIGASGQSQEQVADGQEEPVPELKEGVKNHLQEKWRETVRDFPHRTIFITEQRLVGVGRTGVTDIRVGDKLIMLENMLFPMVIRPRDLGFHEIVGYADIHGLDGQAFHNLGQEQKPPRRVFKVE